MKLMAWMLVWSFLSAVYGQETLKPDKGNKQTALLEKAAIYFSAGKFNSTIDELKEAEAKIKAESNPDKESLGLIHYWKGVSYSRNQDFPEAIESFAEAVKIGYVPEDLHYEYGQVLFASEKYPEARLEFRESVNRRFKRGVSLYYLGFISKEMNERKKAFTYLRAIEKLGSEENKEVHQPAEILIGDIYLEQIEKHPDAFRAVENYVIPQYQKALAINPDSPLADAIQEKIINLQRKYDLVLFQLRNGRPTLVPPYFVRLAAEYGLDSNVTFSPTQTTVDKTETAANFGKTTAMGRYTFYHDDFLSVSPELYFMYTKYFSNHENIFRNDNYYVAPSLRTAYEHSLWKRPAAHLLDYEYSQIQRDINSKHKLEFNSRSHAIMVGEKFNYFMRGESILRMKYRVLDSYLDSSDSKTVSFIYEQLYGLAFNTLLFYFSYDMLRMKDSSFDTNTFTGRADLLMSNIFGIMPSFGVGVSSIKPINNPNRGNELLVIPNARLSSRFGKNWRGNLKYEYQNYDSADQVNFAYKKTLIGFELEYIF